MEKVGTINYRFLLVFIFTMGLNGICLAWTTGGNNQTANVLAAKLGWDASQTRFNNTMINFCSQAGKMLGAFYGGRIIPIGRKKVFIYGNLFSFLTCLLQ
jgi:hypothetical protein